MTPTEVIAFFKGKSKTAKVLNVTYQAVQQWEDAGKIPDVRQFQIEVLSGGLLKADQPAETQRTHKTEAA